MAYGLEIYNESGVAVITITTRLPRFVSTGTVSVSAGQSQNVFIAGLQNDDSWNIMVAPLPASSATTLAYSIAKYSGYFIINNNSTYNMSYEYWVVRS